MTICCATGEYTQDYLLSETTRKVEAGYELVVIESTHTTFKDYNALGRPLSLSAAVQVVRDKIAANDATSCLVVIPDLTAPPEVFLEFFKYIQLANHLPIDVLIGMSPSSVAEQLDEIATGRVCASKDRIYHDKQYTYVNRRQVNDAIYSVLRERQNRKG